MASNGTSHSDHHCLLLGVASSQWALCLTGMCTEQLWSARGPGHSKFLPQNYCASCSPPAHASKPSQGVSLCHCQHEGRDLGWVSLCYSLFTRSADFISAVSLFDSFVSSFTLIGNVDSECKWPQYGRLSKSDYGPGAKDIGGVQGVRTVLPGVLEDGLISSKGKRYFRRQVQSTRNKRQTIPSSSPVQKMNSFVLVISRHPKEKRCQGCTACLRHHLRFHRCPIHALALSDAHLL